MLHSQWHNSDTEARKGFILSWMAADVPCGFTEGRLDGLRSTFPKLRTNSCMLVVFRENLTLACIYCQYIHGQTFCVRYATTHDHFCLTKNACVESQQATIWRVGTQVGSTLRTQTKNSTTSCQSTPLRGRKLSSRGRRWRTARRSRL